MARMDDKLLKRTSRGWASEEAKVLAEVGVAFHAEPTFPTVDGRIDYNRRSRRRAFRSRPKGLDHPGHFVPEDVARGELEVSNPTLGVVLKIGAADPHRFNTHEDLAGSG